MRTKEEMCAITQVEKDQNAVLQWGKSLLSTSSIRKRDIALSSLSYFLSFGGLSVAGPLAYDFGKTTATYIDENSSPLQVILGFFFAITALATLGSLGGVTLADKLNALTTPSKLPSQRENKYLRYSRNSISFLLAFFSALQFAFLTATFIGGGLEFSFIMAIFSFLIYMWFNKDAVDTIMYDVETTTIEYSDLEYKDETVFLMEQIAIAIEKYYIMDEPEVDLIFHIFDKADPITSISNKMRALLQKDQVQLASIPRIKEKSRYYNLLKKIFSYGGFAIGAAVGYAYFDLSAAFFSWFLNYIGHDANNDLLLILLSIIGCIANGALGAVGLKKRSEQFFYFCFDKNYRYITYSTNFKIRKTIFIIGISCGAVAATPVLFAVYNYIKHGYGYPYMLALLIPTFLAPMAVRSESFEKMLNRLINFLRTSRNLMTTDDKKDRLISTLNKFKSDIPKISKNSLLIANTLFVKPKKMEFDLQEEYNEIEYEVIEYSSSSSSGVINY